MSGLNANYYQGNLSELLADYLLSKIGIATPIRRQFDTGTDFYCNLMDTNEQYLTFGNPFAIQIKSISDPTVEFGHKIPEKWKYKNIASIFENQIPFLIGVIDKNKTSIKIYDTSALWQLYNKGPLNFSRIVLSPNEHNGETYRNNVQETKLEGWVGTEADGILYTLDLGNPIIEYDDKDPKEKLFEKSKILKAAILLEQENIINRNLGVRCFKEIKINTTNNDLMIWGMNFSDSYGEEYTRKIYESIRLPLITLSNNLFNQQKTEEHIAVNQVLQNIPPEPFYRDLIKFTSGHWSWVESVLKKYRDFDPRILIPGEKSSLK